MTAQAVARCPVCLLTIGTESACACCGWRLCGPYVLGVPAPPWQREFADRLATAQREHDLRAAARLHRWLAGGGEAAGCSPDRLPILVRGAAPDPAELAALAGPTAPVTSLGTLLGPSLARLVAGETDRIAVIELTPDGVAGHVVGTDAAGTPRVVADHAWPWAVLARGLPANREMLLFRLAGGVGRETAAPPEPPGDAVRNGLRQVTDWLASEPAGPMRGPVLLIRRVAGWPVVDAAARELAAALDPATAAGTPPEPDPGGMPDPGAALKHPLPPVVPVDERSVAAGLLAAPLRHPYALVFGDVEPATRQVRPVARVLFEAGAVAPPEAGPSRSVSLRAAGAGTGELVLAVVARPVGPPERWLPVAGGRLPLPAGTDAVLSVELTGAGAVRFSGPPGVRDTELDWPGLLAGLPETCGADPVDLVCAVELGGPQAELGGLHAEPVWQRIRLVADLLELIEAEHPDPAAIQVGLVGYHDHVHDDMKRWREPVVRTVALGPVRTAAAVLGTWQPAGCEHAYAAPVEDAIHELATPGWQETWREAARHVLVTAGSRPPHPAVSPDRTHSCTFKHDWSADMGRLVATARLRRVAVQDGAPPDLRRAGKGAPERAALAWAALGADAQLTRPTAHQLAEAAGLLPATVRPMPLPVLPVTVPAGVS
jgi:hypothetical protein